MSVRDRVSESLSPRRDMSSAGRLRRGLLLGGAAVVVAIGTWLAGALLPASLARRASRVRAGDIRGERSILHARFAPDGESVVYSATVGVVADRGLSRAPRQPGVTEPRNPARRREGGFAVGTDGSAARRQLQPRDARRRVARGGAPRELVSGCSRRGLVVRRQGARNRPPRRRTRSSRVSDRKGPLRSRRVRGSERAVDREPSRLTRSKAGGLPLGRIPRRRPRRPLEAPRPRIRETGSPGLPPTTSSGSRTMRGARASSARSRSPARSVCSRPCRETSS